MRKEDVGAVSFVENGRPVGFVTDRDIVLNFVASGYDMNKPISHAMTKDPVCVTPDQNIDEAIKLIENPQISHLLVVNDNQRPIGMVSLQDPFQVDMKRVLKQTQKLRGSKKPWVKILVKR